MNESTCGAQRKGFEGGPHIGSNSIPCVRESGNGGDHRDGLGQGWAAAPAQLRRLPWTSATGNPAFLSTDDPNSLLALMADSVESQMTDNASAVLELSREMLSGSEVLSDDEARYVMQRLAECLDDVLEVAAMRGERLGFEGEAHPRK